MNGESKPYGIDEKQILEMIAREQGKLVGIPSQVYVCTEVPPNLSRFMRKPAICISKNRGADQVRSNCAAD